MSYSHAGKGHTEYVREEDAESVLQELENYRTFRELVRKWVKLETELSKARRKSEV